jgi:hypothetical protein
MTHMMLDLETVGTDANSVILSVGAVMFFPFDFEVVSKHYWVFPFQAQLDLGRDISPSTLAWWMTQTPEAQAVFQDSIKTTTTGFVEDVREITALADSSHAVWGNGAAFDNAMMRNLSSQLGIKPEWPWRKDSCYRTIGRMATAKLGNTSWYPNSPAAMRGVHHNAIDDAMWQAKALSNAFAALGIKSYA